MQDNTFLCTIIISILTVIITVILV